MKAKGFTLIPVQKIGNLTVWKYKEIKRFLVAPTYSMTDKCSYTTTSLVKAVDWAKEHSITVKDVTPILDAKALLSGYTGWIGRNDNEQELINAITVALNHLKQALGEK